MGTPFHGANLAAWAAFGGRMARVLGRPNLDLVSVLQPGSEVLLRIQSVFNHYLRRRQEGGHPIHVACYYEELPIPIVGEVRVRAESSSIPRSLANITIACMDERLLILAPDRSQRICHDQWV